LVARILAQQDDTEKYPKPESSGTQGRSLSLIKRAIFHRECYQPFKVHFLTFQVTGSIACGESENGNWFRREGLLRRLLKQIEMI